MGMSCVAPRQLDCVTALRAVVKSYNPVCVTNSMKSTGFTRKPQPWPCGLTCCQFLSDQQPVQRLLREVLNYLFIWKLELHATIIFINISLINLLIIKLLSLEKFPSQYPITQNDIIKLLVLSYQQSKDIKTYRQQQKNMSTFKSHL